MATEEEKYDAKESFGESLEQMKAMREGKVRKTILEGVTPPVEDRYCTVAESIEESLKEVKLMREGKLPKRNWRDAFAELRKELEKENNN